MTKRRHSEAALIRESLAQKPDAAAAAIVKALAAGQDEMPRVSYRRTAPDGHHHGQGPAWAAIVG